MDNIKLFTLISLLLFSPLLGELKNELAYDRDYIYQDLLINNETIWKGLGPDCPSRYEALRSLLNRFDRPFTVLEVGANNGYFSLRIAQEYNATCVMIDGTDRLKRICELNSNQGHLVYLKKYISAEELEYLAKKEHFDIVLCFHVLHHQGENWKKFTDAILKLGDYAVIETPPINDRFINILPTIKEIAPYILSLPSGIQIGSFPRYTPESLDHMILFHRPSNQPFSQGISQQTFEILNGAFSNIPLRDCL